MTTTPTSRAPAGPPGGRHLTLRTFLTLTATTPAPVLRRALAAALLVERPDTPEAYSRFYGRVLSALYAAPCTDREPASQQQVLACVHV